MMHSPERMNETGTNNVLITMWSPAFVAYPKEAKRSELVVERPSGGMSAITDMHHGGDFKMIEIMLLVSNQS